MSFLISTHQNRTRSWTITIYESDQSTPVVLAAADVVRVKIGTNGQEPLIDLSSIEPSENGSTITFTPGGSVCVLKLAQGDLRTRNDDGTYTYLSGAYDVEIGVVDDSENLPADEKEFKTATTGVLSIGPTQQGEIAEEQSSSSQSNSESSSSSSENSESSSSS